TFTDNDKRFTKISANYDKGKPGGKPNGGRGGDAWNWRDKRPAPTYAGGSGGGGSTDVRLLKAGYTGGKQGHGLGDYNTVYSSTKDNRILVAGGGGGAAQGHDIRGYGWPGIAGGLPGKNGKITGGKEYTGKTAGGEDGIGVTGKAFGGNWEGRGGGGGGYKGGRASTEGEEVASGGGGENYTADTNDANFKGDSDRTIKNLLPNGKPDDPEYISPFYGNGKATIKWVDTTPPAPLPAQGGTP
ncbi:MAG: hypothetical protein LBP37_02385, partial [Spirochaetaceae bacterium]|nr:hypothetical protein [Spirochaetaceae bacterium]